MWEEWLERQEGERNRVQGRVKRQEGGDGIAGQE